MLEDVAAELAGADVLVAKVDTSEHPKLSKRFNIKVGGGSARTRVCCLVPDTVWGRRAPSTRFQGLPTLKWFKAGSKKAETYRGGRSKAAILNFVRSSLGSGSGGKDEL